MNACFVEYASEIFSIGVSPIIFSWFRISRRLFVKAKVAPHPVFPSLMISTSPGFNFTRMSLYSVLVSKFLLKINAACCEIG